MQPRLPDNLVNPLNVPVYPLLSIELHLQDMVELNSSLCQLNWLTSIRGEVTAPEVRNSRQTRIDRQQEGVHRIFSSLLLPCHRQQHW